MARAFSPWLVCLFTWGCAPGWDGGAPLALKRRGSDCHRTRVDLVGDGDAFPARLGEKRERSVRSQIEPTKDPPHPSLGRSVPQGCNTRQRFNRRDVPTGRGLFLGFFSTDIKSLRDKLLEATARKRALHLPKLESAAECLDSAQHEAVI